MASSDNLASLEPWLFRPAFPADPWFSDAFARDTDALTRALTNSMAAPAGLSPGDKVLFDVLNSVVSSPSPNPETPRAAGQSITISGSGSGSDLDTASKRSGRRGAPGPVAGKAGKRKSRASKKSPTTFITADAENFRQMVQQVTGGVRFSEARVPSMLAPILKPEAQRLGAGGRIHGCLPTLDTSAFLLEHHQQVVADGGGSAEPQTDPAAATAFSLPSGGEIGFDGGADGTGGLDFGSFSCFPTLDSWEVV